jgi:hypothetical protein
MNWTIGQRITLGYAVVLALFLIVAATGGYTLFRTAGAFTHANTRRG